MAHLTFPGSRWWKFDFHTHTPRGSDDYKGNHTITAVDWLHAHKNRGMDCVVVTDHNSGQWLDELKSTLAGLQTQNADWAQFFVMPGVEISCSGGVHILAILDRDKTTQDIAALVGACGYHGTLGSSDAVTEQSVSNVIDTIHKKGGIAIAAHVDMPKGLLKSVPDTKTLIQVLKKVDALQVVDPKQITGLVSDLECLKLIENLAQIQASDNHNVESLQTGGYTWVKLTKPDLQGLRLALQEPLLSIKWGDAHPQAPQAAPTYWISKLSLEGLVKRRPPMEIQFNPWLNTIIGGRGSGKSSIVECLRLVLGRGQELEGSMKGSEIADSVKKFSEKMLRSDSVIQAEVWGAKDALGLERYVFRDTRRISIQRPGINQHDAWTDTGIDGQSVATQFPVRLFSQKQIHALANRPDGLLAYFDEPGKADRDAWKQQFDAQKSGYLEQRRALRELRTSLKDRASNAANLKQVTDQLKAYIDQGVGQKLSALQTLRAESRAMDEFHNELSALVSEHTQILQATAFTQWSIALPEVPSAPAKAAQAAWHSQRDALQSKLEAMQAAATEMQTVMQAMANDNAYLRWQADNQSQILSLTQSLNAFKIQTGDALQQAGDLQQKKELFEQLEKGFKNKAKLLEAAEKTCADIYKNLETCRNKLTQKRQAFVDKVITEARNDLLRFKFTSCANTNTTAEEANLRRILQLSDTAHQEFVWNKEEDTGLLPFLAKHPDRLFDTKERLQELVLDTDPILRVPGSKLVGDVSLNGYVINALTKLTDEWLDAVWTWFPEDAVEIEFRPNNKEQWQSIQQGSAGQQTAAMLSFILSEGNEPLILDQPEDDLDNAMVYDLVVRQLRDHKSRRQVIIVTHNPNIVVNGDAELVIPMAFRGGQIQTDPANGLQDLGIRKTICNVMEGGKTAFENRYARVLKDLH